MKTTTTEKALLAEHVRMAWDSPRMIDHIVKSTSAILTIGDRIISFDKPTIQTSFHFAEHGHDFDAVNEYAHNMSKNEIFFITENLHRSPAGAVLRQVESARNKSNPSYIVLNPTYTGQPEECALTSIIHRTPRNEMDFGKDLDQAITDEELDQIEAVALAEQTKFEKRLMTYLKRYGLTKCSFNVFWADR